MSLVKRWRLSSLVAWVDVTSTGRLEVDDHPPGQSVVLSIRQVLKGPAANPSKQVRAFTVFGSPFPFHFSKGQRLLVFLSFDDKLKMYTPVAFEGCLELSGKAFQRYAAALKKLPSILDVSDEEARKRRLVDWSVDCAVDPILREDGVIGLWYLRGKEKGTTKDPLTEAHREKLVTAITTEKRPSRHVAIVASLLEPYASPTLDRYLLESLRLSHEPGWRDLTRTAVEQLPGRLKIELAESTQKRLDEWGELLGEVYYDIDKEAEPDRYEDAKERFDVLWGSISREVYDQCRRAMAQKESDASRAIP